MSSSAMSRLLTGQTKMTVEVMHRIYAEIGLSPDASAEARREIARDNAGKMIDALGIRLPSADIVDAVEALTILGGVDDPTFTSEEGVAALQRLAKVMSKFKL